MAAKNYIQEGIPKHLTLKLCQISRSSFYCKPVLDTKTVGRSVSHLTKKKDGGYDNNSTVIAHIKHLLAQPFVDYGYLKTTFFLRNEIGYIINPKKTYRLMKENGLLHTIAATRNYSTRQWVKELVPKPLTEFSYFEFDRGGGPHKVYLYSGKTQ